MCWVYEQSDNVWQEYPDFPFETTWCNILYNPDYAICVDIELKDFDTNMGVFFKEIHGSTYLW